MIGRKQKISGLAAHVERLLAERDFAAVDADHSPAEVATLNHNIKVARKEIIDALSTDELRELTKRGLRPECAAEIIHDGAPAAADDLQKAVWAAQNAEISTRAPIPKFASFRGVLVCELRNQRSSGKSMILVRLPNLKFL